MLPANSSTPSPFNSPLKHVSLSMLLCKMELRVLHVCVCVQSQYLQRKYLPA
jgi:hypothetical protein